MDCIAEKATLILQHCVLAREGLNRIEYFIPASTVFNNYTVTIVIIDRWLVLVGVLNSKRCFHAGSYEFMQSTCFKPTIEYPNKAQAQQSMARSAQ
jgi:hypothetical protein